LHWVVYYYSFMDEDISLLFLGPWEATWAYGLKNWK